MLQCVLGQKSLAIATQCCWSGLSLVTSTASAGHSRVETRSREISRLCRAHCQETRLRRHNQDQGLVVEMSPETEQVLPGSGRVGCSGRRGDQRSLLMVRGSSTPHRVRVENWWEADVVFFAAQCTRITQCGQRVGSIPGSCSGVRVHQGCFPQRIPTL